jgi:type VI secretion system secreted protein Hcp
MSVDYFLKIPGADGDSADSGYKNAIDVLAWSWGMTQSGSMHIAGGGGSGKVSVHDLSVTKYLDKASTVIMQKCASGKHFTEAELICRKAGDTPMDYYKVKMKEVLISSISSGGSSGEDRVTENVTFNFAKMEVEYTPQNADGSAGASATLGWDIRSNVEM